jgi:predicted MPP superfamily phosphohydrolase
MKFEHVAGKLCVDECTALAVCIGVIVFVYLTALVALVRLAVSSKSVTGKPLSIFDKAVFTLAGLGTLCVAYGFFVEPYTLTVNAVQIPSAKLAAGAGPIRVVHLSDMHCDPAPRLELQLPAKVAALKPDIIVFTGDAVNAPEGVSIFKNCLRELSQIAPTYAVFGNHDSRSWPRLNLYDGTGVKVLHGQNDVLKVKGADVAIIGVGVDEEYRLERAFKGVPAKAFNIFLHHFPAEIAKVGGRNVDLLCAGHTHGGQVCLPGYGAVITRSRAGKRFESGLYEVGSTYLYVNRGIGMEGGYAPRVRFLAPPEITVLDIVPQHENLADVERRVR